MNQQLSLFVMPGDQLNMFDHNNNITAIDAVMQNLATQVSQASPVLGEIYSKWEQYAPADLVYSSDKIEVKIEKIIKAIADRDWDMF